MIHYASVSLNSWIIVAYVFFSAIVWDDPPHACCLQRQSRHVQAATSTWRWRELQWTWAWLHSTDVCWTVRYLRDNDLVKQPNWPIFWSIWMYCFLPPLLLREDWHHMDDVGCRSRDRCGQLCWKDSCSDGSICRYVCSLHAPPIWPCMHLVFWHR